MSWAHYRRNVVKNLPKKKYSRDKKYIRGKKQAEFLSMCHIDIKYKIKDTF